MSNVQYDENKQCLMVETPAGWTQMASVSAVGALDSVSFGGGLKTDNGGASVYLESLGALNALFSAVVAGESCRCAPTEVCPECHDLNTALAKARKFLDSISNTSVPFVQSTPFGQASYSGPVSIGTQTLAVGGGLSFTSCVSTNTLKVGT